MPKRGTASILSVDQFAEFSSAVVRNLPRDLDPARVQALIERQETLRDLLHASLVCDQAAPLPAVRLLKTLTITCEGNATAEELVVRGQYTLSNKLITNQRFPLQPHAPIPRTLELLLVDREWSWEDGLAILTDRHLDRPTPEDCFYTGIQHPDEQRAHAIVFPHEPVRGGYGGPVVLVLIGIVGDRRLHLGCTASRWDRHCVLAGVRKVA